MENGLSLHEVEHYVNVVIPNIESELVLNVLSDEERVELYMLYDDVMRIVAPYNFMVYNKYLELDEDHSNPSKSFYHHRKEHLVEMFEAFNDMEMYDKYDMLLISLPPRVGKTSTGIRFLSWIIGKYPHMTQLAVSYSDSITSSFYLGTMEIVQSERYKKIFSDAPLVNQNAKKEEIWLQAMKRYPSILFVPINGSMTGRGEAGNYLYCDDLVSGIEEALSITRLEKLWTTYTVNCKQRKLDGAKEIHVATRWSVHDPITKLAELNSDNPRCKIICIPCYNEDGESNYDYTGGFSTNYYNELENTMDKASFDALYRCEPIERDGLLYLEEDIKYYNMLPEDNVDTIISVCDSKNLGTDNVASPIGYVYGDYIYIDDVVYNNGLPEITRPLVANMWEKHGVVQADVEMNNGGNYYAEELCRLLKDVGAKTSVRMFYSGTNKLVKIISYSDFIKTNFIFRNPKDHPNPEYRTFIRDVLRFTQIGKNKTDDAVDSLSMLAQKFQEMKGSKVRLLDRRKVGI